MLPLYVSAQPDTLGQWPFLSYYNIPELGVMYDSMYCGVRFFTGPNSCQDQENFIVVPQGEKAYFMHTDDTISVTGVAYLSNWGYNGHETNMITIYSDDMEPIAAVRNSSYVYQDLTNIDSEYYHLYIPGYFPVAGGSVQQPLRLTFFEDDTIITLSGDFWIGIVTIAPGAQGLTTTWLGYLTEFHDPPLHFPLRMIRHFFDDTKEWGDVFYTKNIPMLFPIIIPPCVGVDSVRVEVDSAGCLHAEWDSLRWQEQWVVELRANGMEQPLFDTVDSCRWSYCGLDSGAAYSVSVQSRCWNPGERHTWSSFSHRTGTLGIAAQPIAPATPALRLSPNPAKDRVRVECTAEIQTLSVVDAMGRTLVTQREPTIVIRRLPAGIYTVVAATTQGPASARLAVE